MLPLDLSRMNDYIICKHISFKYYWRSVFLSSQKNKFVISTVPSKCAKCLILPKHTFHTIKHCSTYWLLSLFVAPVSNLWEACLLFYSLLLFFCFEQLILLTSMILTCQNFKMEWQGHGAC